MTWLIVYMAAINLLGLLMMGFDKAKARSGGWRVPENKLLLIALAGGSAGVFSGSRLFRHKTRHFKFKVIVPAVFAIQAGIVIYAPFH